MKSHRVRSTPIISSALASVAISIHSSMKNGQEHHLETYYRAPYPMSQINIALPDDPTLREEFLTGTRHLCEALDQAEKSGIIRVDSLNVHFYVGSSDIQEPTSPSLFGTLTDFLDTNFEGMTASVTPET